MFYYTLQEEKNIISSLCDAALKSGGLEQLQVVNYVNMNLKHIAEKDVEKNFSPVEEEKEEEKEIVRDIPKKKKKASTKKKKLLSKNK